MRIPISELLLWSFLAGIGAVGLTTVVRNAPVIRGLVQEAKKPWACNECMPLYTVAAMLAIPIYQTGNWSYAAAYFPGYAVANVILKKLAQPPPGPPRIPEEFRS